MKPAAHSLALPLPDLHGLAHLEPWLLLDASAGPQSVSGLLALGVRRSLTIPTPAPDAFERIEAFIGAGQGRCFGWIGYDQLRADPMLALPEQGAVHVALPTAHWVEAEGVLSFTGTGGTAQLAWLRSPGDAEWAALAERAVRAPVTVPEAESGAPPNEVESSLGRQAHAAAFDRVQQHILRGDIYELNLCRELKGQLPDGFDPVAAFGALVSRTAAPYSALLPFGSVHVLSASPECFLERRGNKLISRPIKGTAPRQQDPVLDRAAAEHLRLDRKERAENLMITDLVRNDLSRIAAPATVEVEELCGIHSFRNVHQMISTVSCTTRKGVRWAEILAATFPMGSMTGAPKLRAVEITAAVEPVLRGVYSGTIGWADPDGADGVGDFHLNVVIRTLIADRAAGTWSTHVGGAITALAQADAEWEETRLKAQAMLEVMDTPLPVSPLATPDPHDRA